MPETPDQIGPTQKLILRMIEDGRTVSDIAEHLGVAFSTANGRVRKIKRLFPGTPIGELPAKAREAGVEF